MPLFMDIHQHPPEGTSAQDVAGAHAMDIKTPEKNAGVHYLKYWVDEADGKVFCLVEEPDTETAAAVHREARGLAADEIIPATEGT